MTGRIVEIAEGGRHLSLHRGFMEARHNDELLARIPLDDLLAVIVSGHGCTHSSNLIAAFAERGTPFIICAANYQPIAWTIPLFGHHAQSARMQAQARAKLPLKKRLWQQVVRTKISNQAAVLEVFGSGGNRLKRLSTNVRSGDPSNVEAQAARYYWSALFPDGFSRNKNGGGINSLLNYGYAIIRSCVARGVTAAGLHPTIGIHHRGPTNPMCLVDDLMEPFRPLADCVVRNLIDKGIHEISPDVKKILASLAVMDMPGPSGVTTLFTAAARFATSLAQILMGENSSLETPQMPTPLTLLSVANGND